MNDHLCIKYAKNRARLNLVKIEIDKLCTMPEGGWDDNMDLSGYRDNFYEQFKGGMDPLADWKGWVHALVDVGSFSKKEMDLAELLDKKKLILKDAGNIKRRIAAYGRKLINRNR